MKYRVLLFLVTTMAQAHSSVGNDCHKALGKHLSEAIHHNKKAAQRYSKITRGASYLLSHSLITLELISKKLVENLDSESEVYQKNGINLFCEELGDMNSLPEFQEKIPKELSPVKFYNYDSKKFSAKYLPLIEADEFEKAYKLVSKDILDLENYPNQQCLTRHFLESIASTLKYSHNHRVEAKKSGLADPLPLIKRYLKLQNTGLSFTRLLDTRAFPLQKEGILIFCQDVPAINWK